MNWITEKHVNIFFLSATIIITFLNDMRFTFCSCLSGDDGSTCIPITGNNVEILASQDSSINSKARGSNKVRCRTCSIVTTVRGNEKF